MHSLLFINLKMQVDIQLYRGKMDFLSDKYISILNRPGPFSAVLHRFLGIVGWLIGFITLTEEDRLAAGIYLGGEKRDG